MSSHASVLHGESLSKQHVGIVGSGVIGLTCALVLSEAGYRVSIIARELPGDVSNNWASPWAAAAVYLHNKNDQDDINLQIDGYKHFFSVAHDHPKSSGVQIVRATEYWDQDEPKNGVWFENTPDFRYLSKEELPQGVKLGYSYTSMVVNPTFYLPWLKEQLTSEYNTRFVQAEISSLQEAQEILGSDVIINASGLGAKTLAKDEDVRGVRGQTMLISCPADEFGNSITEDMKNESIIRRGSEYTYVIPRCFTDGLIIGGIIDYDNKSSDVDVALQNDILRRVNVMTDGHFQDLDLAKDVKQNIVAFRPDRKGGRRIEIEDGIVHAYGFGSSGYQYSYGSALKVKKLVDRLCKPARAVL